MVLETIIAKQIHINNKNVNWSNETYIGMYICMLHYTSIQSDVYKYVLI